MKRFEVVVVGGGIAGLATACHLVAAKVGSVLVLEREELPGYYASGRSAGLGRQLTGLAEHTALTVEGRARLSDVGLIDGSGGLLLSMETDGTELLADEAKTFKLKVDRGPGALLPELRATEFLKVRTDGVIDVPGLLRYCAEEARFLGAELRFGCQAGAIHPGTDGFEVETEAGPVHGRYLVNAAGPWARELGRRAGGLDLPFRLQRRHLAYTAATLPADQPWAWWTDRPLSLRPSGGGLLLSEPERDEDAPLPARGRQPECDKETPARLADVLREVAPDLAAHPITKLRCGLCTFSPDHRFVVGFDPLNPRLLWAAGLEGHGMTAGLAVGELAARILTGKSQAGPLDPARFQS